MNDESLIKILCKELPRDVSQPLFNEYNQRWSEIENMWQQNTNIYSVLQEHKSAVRTLLAMSTYYRRVISGFAGATDFYKKVTGGDLTIDRPVKIGNYTMSLSENKQLWKVQKAFSEFKNKYQIDDTLFDYDDTFGFLRNCYILYTTSNGKQEEQPF